MKRLIFFLCKTFWHVFWSIAKKILHLPLIALYGIHFRLRSHFAKLGLAIQAPFLYVPFSGQTLGYVFITGLGITLIGVNFFFKTTDSDPLNPKNIMAKYIQMADDVLTEEEDVVFTSGIRYAPFEGVQPPLPPEEFQEDITPGDIAHLSDALIKPILPTSDNRVAEPNTIHTYAVQEGDTVSSIAQKFGIRAQTILWANQLMEYSLLQIGQKLVILPSNGILYKIRQGDTLGKIAQRYSVSFDEIISANKLAGSDATLAVGQIILLPNAIQPRIAEPQPQRQQTLLARIKNILVPQKQKSTGRRAGGASLLWPTSASRITQYFSWRHPGVDIAGPSSNDIYAAAGGVVIFSGWQRGYGNTIIVDHGDGKKTRYAHASKLFVYVGESVSRGEVIAKVGSTGRSTGPHLHFEVYAGKSRINPFSLIK
ncbi:peptidoglycan DD-metalloendopeptidase family protein [Candidatus Uhrbacteria bacterium]|nr:peptidoglycan DD-metalloendopeptidase family protein [Candidatus Uhrbacteria bacterium]